MLELLYQPQPSVSYSFILISYAICCSICVALLVMEFALHIDAIKGFWIVFAPFVPCVVWAFAMKRKADSIAALAKDKQE